MQIYMEAGPKTPLLPHSNNVVLNGLGTIATEEMGWAGLVSTH